MSGSSALILSIIGWIAFSSFLLGSPMILLINCIVLCSPGVWRRCCYVSMVPGVGPLVLIVDCLVHYIIRWMEERVGGSVQVPTESGIEATALQPPDTHKGCHYISPSPTTTPLPSPLSGLCFLWQL